MTETHEHLRCFSVNDAASRLCVHRETVYRMVRRESATDARLSM